MAPGRPPSNTDVASTDPLPKVATTYTLASRLMPTRQNCMALEQQQISYVEIIRRSGQDLLRVLNDILDFSKIDAGFLVLEKTPLCPAAIVRDVVMLFAR